MIRLRLFILAFAVCALTACGRHGVTPTSPSTAAETVNGAAPTDRLHANASTSVVLSGPITDTLTGAVVGRLDREVERLPMLLSVSAPGYVTRQAWITTATSGVDLIPEGQFDLGFYRQLARDDFARNQGRLQPLWVLRQAPSFYMEVEGAKGFSRSVAMRLEAVARRIVPAMTGGRLNVMRWETGPTPRTPEAGWIMIERNDDLAGPNVPPGYVVCGLARVGAEAGWIGIHGDQVCRIEPVLAHEIGHALGFFHVSRRGAMMYPYEVAEDSAADAPIDEERLAAAIAYARPRGNRDIDADPAIGASMAAQPLVVK